MTNTQTTAIADEFAAILREWLSADEWSEMRVRNASPAYATACASHDFCDANMAMLEAFAAAMGREPDVSDDADAAIWNAAWDLAKTTHLTAH